MNVMPKYEVMRDDSKNNSMILGMLIWWAQICLTTTFGILAIPCIAFEQKPSSLEQEISTARNFTFRGASETTQQGNYVYQKIPDYEGNDLALTGINSQGVAAGFVLGAPNVFIYREGQFTFIDVPGASNAFTIGIGDAKQVAGIFYNTIPARNSYAFLYENNSLLTLNQPDISWSNIRDLNAHGAVTGNYGQGCDDAGTSCAHVNAFVYHAGIFTNLNCPDKTDPTAWAINDKVEIVINCSGDFYIYRHGELASTNLKALGMWEVIGMNNQRAIVGCRVKYGFKVGPYCGEGVLYADDKLQVLENSECPGSVPVGINNSGQIAGNCCLASWPIGSVCREPYVYRNTTVEFISVPGSNQTTIKAINDIGQVAGSYKYADSQLQGGFIATPAITVLDKFERANGQVGADWDGAVGLRSYKIVGHTLRVRDGGPIYWHLNPFGATQEAYVTLSQVDNAGVEQALLLKTQGSTGDFRKGAIAVKYDADRQTVRLATWRKRSTVWGDYRTIPLTLADGDKLGARVYAEGKVKILHNDKRVATVTLRRRDQKFFNEKTGRIGLWFENAPNAIVDNFGGGTNVAQ